MEDWEAFCEFLSNRQPPLSLSDCTADDAIEFLLTLPSGRINKVADRLSAVNFREIDGNHKESPFGSPTVRTYLKLMKEHAYGKEYKSDYTGEHDKVDLFEKCLTTSDVGSINQLVVTPHGEAQNYFLLAAILGEAESHLLLEDEEGKPWLFGFSYFKLACQSFVLTKCWRSFVKEKQLRVGDFVFFQRHLTDRKRLFIGCRRRDGGTASRDDAPESSLSAVPNPTLPATTAKTIKLGKKLKEVETPFQLRSPEHSVPVVDPVFVISCGDNQDSEERYFISYIFNELRLRGFTPLGYDLTRSIGTGNPEMLYRSRVCIIIFSMNYVRSRECLDGFVAIMDHFKANNLVIIPVFFKARVSDVRDRSGFFEKAFTRLGNSVQATQVLKWRAAMFELCLITRYRYMKGDEVMLAKSIVRDVCLLLNSETNRNLKGMGVRLKNILFEMSQLIFSQSSSPHIVGLWGMAGIGKTTITTEIFRRRAERYDVCYFLPDFHLMCQTKGLSHLREEFFSKIFGEEKVFIDPCDTKLSFTRDRFLGKKVLIVLDGVTSARDAEAFVGGFGWFSGGHTIILTSRNRQVLVQSDVKELYEVPKLSEYESLSLCRQFATEQDWAGKMSLIKELVNYAEGNPLALRVLGSSVQKQCINDEKKHLRRLRQYPPIKIQDAFKTSFNGRDDNEKNIFLDLACFFRGENKDRVVNILDGCGFFTDLGICGLTDESLISLVDNKIEMPNIFQDTGRFFVRQENKEAGKRSRLWDSNDIADVLINNSGTEAIEAIFLDVSGLTFKLNPTVFERMHRLRLLKFYCPTSENHCSVWLPQGLHSLPDELRLLHWERYPLGSLPRNFNPKNLVEVNMPYSNLTKLWKGTKNLEKLKRIILSHSRQLTKFPRLSKASNLEHIDLEGCTSLVKVNSSILHHHKLTFLSLKDCSHLRIMPTTIHLESLEVLNLSGCSELEDLKDLSPNLKELYLARTAIRELPSSIGDLTRLVTLDLENCNKLQHLPPELSNMKAVVTRSAKCPASSKDSRDLSSLEDLAPLYGIYRLKRVIETVILGLRKRKREKSVSIATNLSEVQLGSASTAASGLSDNPIWEYSGLPERPGQPECTYYMKTGHCNFRNQCKLHHPRDRKTHVPESSLSSLGLPLRPVQLGSASTTVSDLSDNPIWEYSGLPERPGQPECTYYMRTGDCKFGNDCKFHHPRDRETHVPESSLSSLGLPLRPGKPVCALYFHTGSCSAGPTCIFDHPSLITTHKNTSFVPSETPHLNEREFSSLASETRHLSPLGYSSSIGDSSSELVEAATKKRRIHKNTSPVASETRHLSPLRFSSSIGDSSCELVEASTLKPTIHKNASSMASEKPHLNPLGLSSASELVEPSTVSEITQATVGRDNVDLWDVNEDDFQFWLHPF